MRKRDPEKAARRRRQILEAAAVCFLRRGFHRASMQEICAEAGMSPGALYRYFDGKDAIIRAIAEDEREDNARLLQALADAPDLVTGLSRIGRAALEAGADPDYGRLAVEIMAEAARNPEVAAIFRRNDAEVKEALTDALRAVRTAGTLDPAIDPAAAAEILIALYDGLSARALLNPEFDPGQVAPLLDQLLTRFLLRARS